MLNNVIQKNYLQDKKGFTLMEMLIVVAIIAVLVAVSVPIASNMTKKAQLATDKANMRTAMAVLRANLNDGTFIDQFGPNATLWTICGMPYNAKTGRFETTNPTEGYRKYLYNSATNKYEPTWTNNIIRIKVLAGNATTAQNTLVSKADPQKITLIWSGCTHEYPVYTYSSTDCLDGTNLGGRHVYYYDNNVYEWYDTTMKKNI